ncbi:MAG: exodeoxyribonuclease VII large subunit, partial [Deltaproteobacteria bacterium]|nr:exodeoxyribonuclease VII large subunit [Deltaproteobacteria bacterium]
MSDDTRPPHTPTTIAAAIEARLAESFGRVSVEGEVSGTYKGTGPGIYFNLKDDKCLLRSVLWKRPGSAVYGDLVTNGAKLLATGVLRCYGQRSEYQLNVEKLMPKGEGNLKRAYELLKAKLAKEGLFDPARKRPLPPFPKRVALLTSKNGAAVMDFLKTALARFPGAAISLYPVKVQGAEAAEEMANALADLNVWGIHDLAVLTRGGGSLEDLWAFNEEKLVRAVAS